MKHLACVVSALGVAAGAGQRATSLLQAQDCSSACAGRQCTDGLVPKWQSDGGIGCECVCVKEGTASSTERATPGFDAPKNDGSSSQWIPPVDGPRGVMFSLAVHTSLGTAADTVDNIAKFNPTSGQVVQLSSTLGVMQSEVDEFWVLLKGSYPLALLNPERTSIEPVGNSILRAHLLNFRHALKESTFTHFAFASTSMLFVKPGYDAHIVHFDCSNSFRVSPTNEEKRMDRPDTKVVFAAQDRPLTGRMKLDGVSQLRQQEVEGAFFTTELLREFDERVGGALFSPEAGGIPSAGDAASSSDTSYPAEEYWLPTLMREAPRVNADSLVLLNYGCELCLSVADVSAALKGNNPHDAAYSQWGGKPGSYFAVKRVSEALDDPVRVAVREGPFKLLKGPTEGWLDSSILPDSRRAEGELQAALQVLGMRARNVRSGGRLNVALDSIFSASPPPPSDAASGGGGTPFGRDSGGVRVISKAAMKAAKKD